MFAYEGSIPFTRSLPHKHHVRGRFGPHGNSSGNKNGNTFAFHPHLFANPLLACRGGVIGRSHPPKTESVQTFKRQTCASLATERYPSVDPVELAFSAFADFAGSDPPTRFRSTIRLTRGGSALRRLTHSSFMTTLTIRLPDTLKTDLDKLSRRENKAVSDLVRESLRRSGKIPCSPEENPAVCRSPRALE